MSSNATATSPQSTARSHRLLLLVLASVSIVFAWFWMGALASPSPWYRNANMDAHNVADALALNSGYPLGTVDQPAAPTKFLLALDFRVRNALGLQPVWTLKRFARSADPIHELAELILIGRTHSRVLVVAFILIAAGAVGQFTRRLDAACLAAILLSGSSGLLFQGMLLHPELLSALFGGVLALQAAWLAVAASQPTRRTLWMFVAGVFGGLAVLSKFPSALYLAVVFLWCALAPLTSAPEARPAAAIPHSRGWLAAICALTALAMLAFLFAVRTQLEAAAPLALVRVRALAAGVALLPLLAFVPTQHRVSRYVVDRFLDVAILGGGLLAAFLGWFGLLRAVVPVPESASYLAKICQTIFNPEPLLLLYTQPGSSHQLSEALRYFLDRPALIVVTGLFVAALIQFRPAPARWRLLIALLFTQSIGMVLLASKRGFLPQFGLYLEVPLLLSWCVGLTALHDWWCKTQPESEQRWPAALAIVAAFILTLTVPLRLQPKYQSYGSDYGPAPNGMTTTFLYDHDAHPPAYLAAMKARYPNRAAFEAALNRYLNDPASHR